MNRQHSPESHRSEAPVFVVDVDYWAELPPGTEAVVQRGDHVLRHHRVDGVRTPTFDDPFWYEDYLVGDRPLGYRLNVGGVPGAGFDSQRRKPMPYASTEAINSAITELFHQFRQLGEPFGGVDRRSDGSGNKSLNQLFTSEVPFYVDLELADERGWVTLLWSELIDVAIEPGSPAVLKSMMPRKIYSPEQQHAYFDEATCSPADRAASQEWIDCLQASSDVPVGSIVEAASMPIAKWRERSLIWIVPRGGSPFTVKMSVAQADKMSDRWRLEGPLWSCVCGETGKTGDIDQPRLCRTEIDLFELVDGAPCPNCGVI